jgi:hypothetical protein
MIRDSDIVLDVAAGTILAAAVLLILCGLILHSREDARRTGTRFGVPLWTYMIMGAFVGLFVVWRLLT